ncbi:hypothetical protein [Nonomuraea sp. NPDC049750]|uniref:hypothetical protein n=1 Tax=Nonomuraea sp. NPDC049750 TaxID=3154738 RepID=UPI003405C4DA
MSELLAVLDARTLDGQQPKVAAWAQAVGIDPRDVYRIDLRYDGRLFARVREWDTDENGARYCRRDHNHLDFSQRCEIAQREPYDVTIINAGPQGVGDRVKARTDVTANECQALAPVLAVVRTQLKPMRAAYDRRRRARARRSR